MGAGVAQLVADVDRLLTRAHELFPASGGSAGTVFAASGGQGAAPPAPGGGSGLGSGVAGAAGAYGAVRWKPALNAFAVTFADRMPDLNRG
ncbi:hypothetical protein [Mycobacterium kiyosense]|uniref:hypothetical protein n=1 Tax=Mycobacterium kiyosense TaxID=2871094 RepID=UPI002231D0FC|nr:hypothetical protein [Mycobacterium kiyosense]GLB99397.1 hypothetical protein SRL2020226_61730 [Mycobacterium kiyosense]